MSKLFSGAGIATAVLLAGCLSANANVLSPTSVDFDAPPESGQTMVVDFDDPIATGYSWTTWSGAELHQTPLVSGIAAPPYGDSSLYLAVLTGGNATLSTPLLDSLSIYIGSIDTYNKITFRGLGGFSQSFGGLDLFPPADGNQFVASTNRRFFFTFDQNDKINQIEFTSSGNSFEFDNIAVRATITPRPRDVPVPEPLTLSIFGAGLGCTIAARRRRKMRANMSE